MYPRNFFIIVLAFAGLSLGLGYALTLCEECSLPGDYPPCGEVIASEVASFIELWVGDEALLADVVVLADAWDSTGEEDPQPPASQCTQLMSGDTREIMEEFFANYSDSVAEEDLMAILDALQAEALSNARGPNAHRVFYSTSADGLVYSSETPIINSTSVPDAILMGDGTIRIYGISGDTYRTMKHIAADLAYPLSYSEFETAMCPVGVPEELATFHSNDGVNFTFDLLRITNLSLDYAYADPSIVKLDDGSMRLYFMGANKSLEWGSEDPASAPVHHIFSATSADGVNFTMEQGYRFTGSDLTDPDVLKIGEEYRMYWNGGRFAVSVDGLEYTEDSEGLGFYIFCVDVNDWNDGGYRMYYNGNETFPYEGGEVSPSDYISSYASDGIGWVRDPGMRIGGSGCGSLIELNPTSYILYTLH